MRDKRLHEIEPENKGDARMPMAMRVAVGVLAAAPFLLFGAFVLLDRWLR